ncbi:50S ribosomal protein L29 [Nanoarchaeota archaeon]
MKRKEIRDLPKGELEKKLGELRRSLMKENAQIKIGTTPSNPGKVKQIKKMIAKLITKSKNTEAEKASSNKQEV